METNIFSALSVHGFTPVNASVCVGTWRNYAVTLQKFGGKTYYVYVALRLGTVPKGLKKTLNAELKEPGIKLGGVERIMPNFLQFSVSFAGAEDPAARFAQRMEALTQALLRNGIYPADTCALTGAPNPDSLCLLLRSDCYGYQPVQSAAMQRSDAEIQARTRENESGGSYLTGVLGAILGMLAGIAVNLLTMVFLQRIFSLLFALVPVGAMFGYKLCKGKTNKLSILLVILLSLIAIPLMEYLSIALGLVKEYGAPLGEALRLTGDMFFEPEVLKSSSGDMLKMLLFMGLGLFISWGYMRNQLNSTQEQRSKIQLDTLSPNPNHRPAPEQSVPSCGNPGEEM